MDSKFKKAKIDSQLQENEMDIAGVRNSSYVAEQSRLKNDARGLLPKFSRSENGAASVDRKFSLSNENGAAKRVVKREANEPRLERPPVDGIEDYQRALRVGFTGVGTFIGGIGGGVGGFQAAHANHANANVSFAALAASSAGLASLLGAAGWKLGDYVGDKLNYMYSKGRYAPGAPVDIEMGQQDITHF